MPDYDSRYEEAREQIAAEPKPEFSDLSWVKGDGEISYTSHLGITTHASLGMLLISKAWYSGCDMEDLADGYGAGQGTHGDWSGIRDSSPEAHERQLERALNHLFPRD